MLSNKMMAGKTASNILYEIAAALIDTDPFIRPVKKNRRTSYRFIPSTLQGEMPLRNSLVLTTTGLLSSQILSFEGSLLDIWRTL